MPPVLTFPSTAEITHIVRNRVVDVSAFRARSFCPITPEYAADIQYDILQSSFGMTKAHQIGTNPTTVNVPIMDTKRHGTGYWKETVRLNEKELLYARAAGSWNQRAGRDLVVQRSLHLDTRLETRIEWLSWQPLVANTLNIDENGVKYTVDFKVPDSNKVTPAIKWTDAENCDVVSDINEWLLLYRGSGAKPKKVSFNQQTATWIINSKKFQDTLKQSQFAGLLSVSNVADALKLRISTVDFEVYDEGYLEENETDHTYDFKPFIPDGVVSIRGDYTGEKMMDFATTISLHNGGLDKPQPGKFSIVEDKSSQEKNPYIDMTVGIYGLPRVFHPNWIVRAKVN